MHRLITALMALVSLLAANLNPAGAQRTEQPTVPPFVSQTVPDSVSPGSSLHSELPSSQPRSVSFPADKYPILEVPAQDTLSTLVVRDKNFILAGHVEQDVIAINCNTIIKPGATVGNVLTAVGGNVTDESGGQVHVVRQSASIIPALDAALLPVSEPSHVAENVKPRSVIVKIPQNTRHARSKDDWAGGQFALMLLGGVAGLLALIVAPRATERTGESLTQEPGRCLVVGVLGSGVMLIALWFNSGLINSPFHFVWLPLAASFAGLCLGALAFGWVCGMRYIGQRLARRFGRTGAIGMWIQIFMGLGSFFLANVVLGKINQGLGIVGLLLEFVLTLAGLGAALLTGFGADPNWLTARMRGEVRWLSRSPRL